MMEYGTCPLRGGEKVGRDRERESAEISCETTCLSVA